MELLRDKGKPIEEAGVRRFGVSRDSPWTHIDFPLLSDFNAEATRGFGIGHVYRGMHDVSERTAFLIDESGTVRGAWRYESSEVPDVDALVSAAQALQG